MKCIYIRLSLFCILGLIFSCEVDKTDSTFDRQPALRTADRVSELKELLLSQEQGYRGIYFTKNDEFGGWNFHMKFNADETVITTSDVNNQTDIINSRYKVRLGTTTELVFTTNSHIQKLSEASGSMPSAFAGNSAFQYFSNDNGVITFREIRSDGIFIIAPTGYSDFELESIASANQTLFNRNEFVNTPQATVFPFLSIEKDGESISFDLNYNAQNLFASPTTFGSDGLVIQENFGIAFTETGIIINPALEFEGVLFESFEFDSTSGFQYKSTVNGVTATIGYGETPATPLDFYNYGFHRAGIFNMDERFKSSAAFNSFYNDYTAGLNTDFGLQITNVILWELMPSGTQSFIQIRTNGFGTFNWDFDSVLDNGVVTFTLTGDTSANVSPFIISIFQPLLDEILGGTSGYYAVNAGGYLNFSNRTFSLINVDDASKAINFWTF